MKKQMRTNRQTQGFTLIELLIVIAIIGILAGLLFSNFTGARERARDTQRKSDLRAMKQALVLYSNDHNGNFPLASSTGLILGCDSAATAACDWGGTFSGGNPPTIYMGKLPKDPLDDGSSAYTYTYAASPTVDFTISARLENASDADSAASQTQCGIAEGSVAAQVYMVCNQ